MRYFVTGSTGLIGSHVVTKLLEHGHEVVALTRSRANADHLPEGATVVEGDITEKESMRNSMKGVDGVFHIAAWFYVGPGPGNVEKAEQINVTGTRNVLELMDELAIQKGVYTSTIGVYPLRELEYIDETIAPRCPESAVYYRTKWEAHYEVAKPMIDDGLSLVVVQPGIVYGPGDKVYGSIRGLFRGYLQGEIPMIPRVHYAPWDHVGDIADGHVRAMEQGTPGETYIISGPSREIVDVLRCAENITGIPVPRIVSPKVIGGVAKLMGAVERFVTPPEGLEAETLRFLAGPQWPVDNSKATEELGIVHRPLENGLRDYLEWEMDQLGIQGEGLAVAQR
ncbi:NAD-dependent epimerase/dehydratase family protein [Natrialbaceae archaeon A-CW2]|uniref:NAD-dependent epimerase/dehydratase family protein n=1 Tax=Natronosalvus amylolyticus TaxID=2961994 RepID=UPI0020C9C47C|nr:NAD-dependent epimerase/dehydratase family protein [Natronosalvus amylolyticus]